MKLILKICALLWLLFSLSAPVALCDKGAIPIGLDEIHQIGQLAAIAWRDGLEVLIISPSLLIPMRPTPVHVKPYALELIPMPSIPEVEGADFHVFKALTELVRVKSPMEPYAILKGPERVVEVEVIYHKAIEAHDINVLRAKDVDALLKWIAEYVEAKGLPRPSEHVLNELSEIASAYVKEGFEYFVFDLISLIEGPMTVKPLLYRFKSEAIYYPLRISKLMKGYASVRIFIITSERIKPETVWDADLKITFEGLVSLRDVEMADWRLAEPFKGLDKVWLTVLTWRGEVKSLRKDLKAQVGFSFEHVKPLLAWLSPVLASTVLITICYVYTYKRVVKGGR